MKRAVDSVIATREPGEMTAVLSMLGKGDTRRSVARELLQVVDAAYAMQRGCDADVWNKLATPKLPSEADLTRTAGHLRQANPTQ